MKAGFFAKDVTPPVGVYLAGYPGRDEPSAAVDDPLYLRVLALEDDDRERLVLVTADLLKLPCDMAWRTKAWCQRALSLRSASVIINLSHTHAAPGLFLQRCYPQWPVDPDYVCFVERSVREGIAAAVADLQPMRMAFGLHQAHFGISRRLPHPERDGMVTMAPNPQGYYDPDLPVLVFYTPGGELRAVLYSYACHPTSKSSLGISADYPGQIAQGLQRELGNGVVPIFAQGAAGSVMPRMRLGDDPEAYRRYWAAAASDLADFVRSGAMRELRPTLRCAESEFELPYDLRRMPSVEQLLSYADPRDTPLPMDYRPANRSIMRLWANDLFEQVRTNTVPTGFRMHLTKVRLSQDLQIVALSGEVTAEVGRMIKEALAPQQTVFFGYCSYTDAYIPAAAMLPYGGHEALVSIYFHERPAPFTAEIDDIIRREVRALEV